MHGSAAIRLRKNPFFSELPGNRETDEKGAKHGQTVFPLATLPANLARDLKGSIEEAFQDLGGLRGISFFKTLRPDATLTSAVPMGIENLDLALREILGTGRLMVVNHRAKTLGNRLGKDISPKRKPLRPFPTSGRDLSRWRFDARGTFCTVH